MARSYAKLLTSIWRDDDFRALDMEAQRLYMLLISQPDMSVAGVLPLRISKWAKLAADSTVEGIAKAFATLTATRFVVIDEDSEEALVRSFIRHDDGWRTPNIHKSIIAAIANIESVDLKAVAALELDKAAGHKPCETLTTTLSEQIPHPSSQQPATTTETSSSSRAPADGIAAAAVELVVQHRIATNRPDDRASYARSVRKGIWNDHGPALNSTMPPHDVDQARWLAVHILGLTQDQALTAAHALKRGAA